MSQHLERRLKAFTYHAPSTPVQTQMAMVREQCMDLAHTLDTVLPETGDPVRYTALAFTALEECAMWAMKALSHGDPDGKETSP